MVDRVWSNSQRCLKSGVGRSWFIKNSLLKQIKEDVGKGTNCSFGGGGGGGEGSSRCHHPSPSKFQSYT